eukprot:3939194-Rhodomonas_salina.2
MLPPPAPARSSTPHPRVLCAAAGPSSTVCVTNNPPPALLHLIELGPENRVRIACLCWARPAPRNTVASSPTRAPTTVPFLSLPFSNPRNRCGGGGGDGVDDVDGDDGGVGCCGVGGSGSGGSGGGGTAHPRREPPAAPRPVDAAQGQAGRPCFKWGLSCWASPRGWTVQ